MSQEQAPQMNAPLAVESEPSKNTEQVSRASVETKTPLEAPLVSEEDLNRMREQIAEAFKDSSSLPGKGHEWKPETGKLEQGITLARITNKLFWAGALKPLFSRGKKIEHSRENRDQKSA